MKKKLAVVLGTLSFVWLFVPDPSDVVPVVGWIDEGMAGALLLWSLKTLGVTPARILARMGSPRRPAPDDEALLLPR